MKIVRFLSIVFLVTIFSLFSGFVLSYRANEALNNRYQPPKIALENYKNLPEIAPSFDAIGFADVAWKTFVNLNWPANYDGSPLKEVKLGEAPLAPRVWEFYRTPEEVFLANGENPLLNISNPFAKTLHLDLIEGQGVGSPENTDLEENLRKSRAWIEKVIHRECPGELPICAEEKKLILNKIPLVDRRVNYIIIEIHLNQNEFNQIVENKWYDASKLAEYNQNDFLFKSTKSSTDAPIEVKAAWRVFDEKTSQEEKARYYTTKRILAIPADQYVCTSDNCRTGDGDPVLEEVEVGLIGFHIAYKIPAQQGSPGQSSATPGWIWASFEQVDNLKVDNPPSGLDLKPTLSNPDCQKNSDRENCLPNYPYVEWPFLWRDRSPHAVTRSKDGQIKEQIPTHVERLSENTQLADTVKQSLAQQNKNWQQAFRDGADDSVWQYYELIGTQWVRNPTIFKQNPPLPTDKLISDIRNKQVMPGALVNVAIEAYLQYQKNGNSCISCHVTAMLPSSNNSSQKIFSDFSFMLERVKSYHNLSSDRQTKF